MRPTCHIDRRPRGATQSLFASALYTSSGQTGAWLQYASQVQATCLANSPVRTSCLPIPETITENDGSTSSRSSERFGRQAAFGTISWKNTGPLASYRV